MIFANLKLTLQSISKNFFLTMLMMVLFPIIMVLMMSFFNSGMYEQPVEDLNIPIRIVDEDQTARSDLIRRTLQSQALHGLVDFSDEPDFTITIPKGYEEALQTNQPAVIPIEGIVDASGFQGETLRMIVDSLNTAQQTNLRLETAINSDSPDPAAQQRIRTAVQAAQSSNSVQTHPYEPAIRITALENFSLQYIQLIFILFLTSYAAASKQQSETTDLDMRVQSLPVSPLFLQLSEMIASAFQIFLYGILYILIVRLLGWGFTGNFLQYTVALFFASFFVAGFSLAYTALVPRKWSSVLGSLLMMFILFFGGMVGPPMMFHGTPLEALANLNVAQILTGPFLAVNLGTFSLHSLRLFLIGTVVSIGLTAAIERMKKGAFR